MMDMRSLMRIIESQRLDELTRPDMEEAHFILAKAGYKTLGSGTFATVVQKPGANYVLKLFLASDDAYLSFIDLVRENPNRHFPKFQGKVVKVTDHYYAIRMEPLRAGNTYFMTPIRNYIMPYSDVAYEKAVEFMDDYPELKQACDLVKELAESGFELDLGDKNMMGRANGDIVLTDPICSFPYGA